MTLLAVFTFTSVSDADAVAALLPGLDAEWPPGRTDVAVVRWDRVSSRPSTRHLPQAARVGGVDDSFWGLLFGHALFEPLLRSVLDGSSPASGNPLALVGIDDGFLHEVRSAVTPGTSALVVLTSGQAFDVIARASTETYAGLIQVHLSREEEDALVQVFGGRTSPVRRDRAFRSL